MILSSTLDHSGATYLYSLYVCGLQRVCLCMAGMSVVCMSKNSRMLFCLWNWRRVYRNLRSAIVGLSQPFPCVISLRGFDSRMFLCQLEWL